MAGRTVTIKLDKERALKYDLNAIAVIGERLGITVRLDQLGTDLTQTPLPLSALRTILWAGLKHQDSDLTEEDVGAMVDQENVAYVLECFFSLFGNKFSDLFPKDPRGAVEELVSTGPNSAESPVAP